MVWEVKVPEIDLFSKIPFQGDPPLYPGVDRITTTWHDEGLCKGSYDPDAFFRGGEGQVYVKNSCRPCPVRRDCLNYALDRNIEDGIWGGLTGYERRRLKEGRPTNWTRVLLRS